MLMMTACKFILYADNSDISYAHRDPDIIPQKLGSVLEKCISWLVDNRLSVHLGKTASILFGPQENLKMLQILKFCVMVRLLKVLTVSNT